MSRVPTNLQTTAKSEIGEYLVETILEYLASGKSPVIGETFPRLNKEYAKKFKNGNTTPNLELDGDLKDAITFEELEDGIEIGVFDDSQVPKADGHNNFSGESELPLRRFIPDSDQNFRREIQSRIDSIISRYEEDIVSDDLEALFSSFSDEGISTTILQSDLLAELLNFDLIREITRGQS